MSNYYNQQFHKQQVKKPANIQIYWTGLNVQLNEQTNKTSNHYNYSKLGFKDLK